MLEYTIKRLLLLVVTLFGIAVLTFGLTRLTPGDPAALQIQGAGTAAQAVGGYDDLVALNRRNLGLDRPLFFNLQFAGRETMAHRAITDMFRVADYWRRDGQRRLLRQSTIGLGPALERYAIIGTPEEDGYREGTGGEAGTLVSEEQRRARLAELFPRLAGERAEDHPTLTPGEAFDYWSAWYEVNQARFDELYIASIVERYLAEQDPERLAGLEEEVRRAGGFAVPYLIEELRTRDLETFRRVNRALSRQTGFTFLVSEDQLAERIEEVRDRWGSWWRREKMSFVRQTPASHAVNVFRNTQFGLWVLQAATFDFGDSYVQRRPVSRMVGEALPISVVISGISILLSYIIAVPIGIFSAVRRYTTSDKMITVVLFVLYSLPSFWVAGLMLLFFTGPPFFDWFPTRGINSEGIHRGAPGVSTGRWLMDSMWHLVLPVTCLTYGSLAYISRQMRSAMLETLHQDFIRTAYAKGVGARAIIFKHALRNSLIPILTISAGLLPELIAGAVIIESIFTIPGMGTLTFEAIVNRDYPVVNAVLVFSALLTLLGILIVDLSYALVDPRISYD